MTCRELTEFLMAYLGGELPAAERTEFDRHLAACPPCRTYLATYEATIQLGKAACEPLDDEPPPEVPKELLAAILAARRIGEKQ